MTNATHSVHVTIFTDAHASTLETKTLTLPALRDLICSARARSKSHLQLLKLAKFGDERTDRNCLRHNDNIRAIFGIETDYDGEQLSFDAAVATIRQARLAALLYTSPSHTDDKPRWRILLPTSDSWSPAMRERLVARVNGLFGGALAKESFTLSQAYYYGRVGDRPQRCEIVDGDFINLRFDLDEGAIYPGGNDGEAHQPNEDKQADIERVIAALAVIPNDDQVYRDAWVTVGMATKAATDGSDDGFAAFDAWSKRHQTYNEDYTADKWKSFKPKRIGAGKLFYLAEQAWPGWEDDPRSTTTIRAFADAVWTPTDAPPPQPDTQAEQPTATPDINNQPGLDSWDVGDDTELPPPREWLLGNQFCRSFLSGMTSPGGTGKTTLRLIQALSLATGRALINQHVFVRCRVLIVSLEDDRNEIRRRLRALREMYGIKDEELGGRLFVCNPKNIKLAEPMSKGRGRKTGPLEQRLRREIERRKPDLVILDPFIKTQSFEENDNAAMDFVCDLMAALAVDYNIAVDAPHHTHKGQLTPGDADSGRGASATRDAGRLVYTLTLMNEQEAKTFGVSEGDRRNYIRLDSAKVNIAPPSRDATWFKLVSVPLLNGNETYIGDNMQGIEPWTPPEEFAGFSDDDQQAALAEIDAGLPAGDGAVAGERRYTDHGSAKGRAAWVVVQKHCTSKNEKQCKQIINAWVKTEVLISREYHDPQDRKTRWGLWLGNPQGPPGSRNY
jgi:hypothetical protein